MVTPSTTTKTDHQGENLFYTRVSVQGKICSVKIDERSCTNVVSEYMVKKLGLKVKKDPWLDDNYKIRVDRKVMVPITLGKYEEEILCDVLSMDSCHMLLGRPWISDHKATHDDFTNHYSFSLNSKRMVLVPLNPQEVYQDQLMLKQRVNQVVSESLNPCHQKEKVLEADSEETPMSLTNIAPELPCPSEEPFLLQDSKDTSEDPKELPPILGGVSQEETSAKTKGRLSEVVSEVAYELDFEVASEVQSCEKEERPETYLSLVCPVFKPRKPPDHASRGIIITAEPTQHFLLDTKLSETQNLIQFWQTFLKGHSFKLYASKLSTSSIIHLFCPMSAQEDTGSLEKHRCLGAEDALKIVAIKEKPPDLQRPQSIQTKQGAMNEVESVTRGEALLVPSKEEDFTSSFQIKEKPPDICQQTPQPHTRESNADYRGSLKRPRRTSKREEDKRFKPPDLDQDKHQDINISSLTKEAPPDAIYKPKPSSNRSQGKFHKRSSFNNIDLVPLLAGKTDLRTNPFQVGEDDVIMASLEHEDKKQHEPEENGTKEQLVAEEEHGIKDHLEPEETKEEEAEAAQKVVQEEARNENKTEASPHHLLHTIQACLVCAYPTTLVVSQAT